MSNEATPGSGGSGRRSGQLTPEQRESIDTLRRVLRIQIDGDWDETMINAAFDRLERLVLGAAEDEEPAAREEAPQRLRPRGPGPRRRGRRG